MLCFGLFLFKTEGLNIMAKTGRKTKLTPELQEQIVRYIEAGNYAKVACQAVGISEKTYYKWKRQGKEAEYKLEEGKKLTNKENELSQLSQSIRQAEARGEVRNVTTIQIAAKKDWRAALEMLARKHPKRWGRKEMHGGIKDSPTKIEIKREDLEKELIDKFNLMRSRVPLTHRKKYLEKELEKVNEAIKKEKKEVKFKEPREITEFLTMED